jgi:hypothetical protein
MLRLWTLLALAAAIGLARVVPAPTAQAAATQPIPAVSPTTPVTITIDPFAPGPQVPQRFLGLSFEVGSLDRLAHYADTGDLVTMLRSLGPGVLRFGGITADENVAWTDPSTPAPSWASSTIDAADLHAIGVLAKRSDWRVLLTVGLAHDEPVAAAREVAAAHAALGPYLLAVEIGNEPDSYGAHGYRALPWIAQGYEEEVDEYREAIQSLTPGIQIAGPDVSGSGVFPEWGEEEALSQRPALLTGHHYPLGCAQTPPPSIESLLSPAIRGREAQSLETYLQVSHAYGIPLRIDETNTVSCGGVAGISDTFASSLWASAYITQAMSAGVAGINLEGNPSNCVGYTPLCAPDPTSLTDGDLRAQPEWYALLLTRSLVGYSPLPTTISTVSSSSTGSSPATAPATGSTPSAGSAPLNLVASSFTGPDHSIQVVLVNDEPVGASPLSLTLNMGTNMGSAHVLRLTAPAQNATDDVSLAGRSVAANGSWRAPTQTETVATQAGTLPLTLSPSSAALITVSPPAPRAVSKSHRGRRRSKARQ